MSAESDGPPISGWGVDPFEELQRLWRAITEGKASGVPHIVGRVSIVNGVVSDIEMSVIIHTTEDELFFREGTDVYFRIPVSPQEGIEGIYIKLNRILGEVR